MKKLLALLLAVLMMFSLVACGGGSDKDDDKPSSTPSIVTGEEDPEENESKEPLVLEGVDQYVVCVKKGSTLTLSSIKDIAGHPVGIAYGGDGEKIAYHYGATVVGYSGENDAFSELVCGTSLDFVIVKKMAGEVYQNRGMAEIVLDPIVIE